MLKTPTSKGLRGSTLANLSILTLALSGGGASSLAAEARDAKSEATESSDALSEVVVTSTRQAAPLSRVPISVEVFSEKQMDEQGVKQFSDIARLTPGLTINSTGSGANNIAIRGVSSQAGASTTGVYIDDVPIQVRQVGYAAGTQFPEVFDLERVEILRGPQGTLFGAGSEGGTVRFIQAAPSVSLYSGYSRVEGSKTQGSDGSYEAGSAFGGPIVKDLLGFRVSAFYRHDGGYIDRLPESFTQNDATGAGYAAANTAVQTGPGQMNANSQNTVAARGALKWQLAENLSIMPSFYYQKQTQGDVENAFWLSGSDPGSNRFVTPQFTAAPGSGLILPQSQRGELKLSVGSIAAQWDLSRVSIISTSAWLDQQKVQYTDQTPYYAVAAIDPTTQPYPLPGQKAQNLYQDAQKVWSQEIRVQSNDTASMLQWVAGAFYSHANQFSHQYTEDNIWGTATTFYGTPLTPGGDPFGAGYSPYQNFFGTPLLNGAGTYLADARTIEEQYAAFAQADLKFIDKLDVTLGLRYSKNKLRYTLASDGAENNLNSPYGAPCPTGPTCTYGAGVFAPAFPSGDIANSESAVTPKAGVSYQITEENFVYASATKGFRPGGAQVTLPSAAIRTWSITATSMRTERPRHR